MKYFKNWIKAQYYMFVYKVKKWDYFKKPGANKFGFFYMLPMALENEIQIINETKFNYFEYLRLIKEREYWIRVAREKRTAKRFFTPEHTTYRR